MKENAENAAESVKSVTLNDVCSDILEGTDGVVGCGVIDIENSLVLGVAHNVPGLNEAYVEAIAAAMVDLFRGRTVQAVEDLLGNQYGKKVENSVQELQITTKYALNFMNIVPGKPNALFVLATDRSIKLGLGWTLVRANSQKIAPLCP